MREPSDIINEPTAPVYPTLEPEPQPQPYVEPSDTTPTVIEPLPFDNPLPGRVCPAGYYEMAGLCYPEVIPAEPILTPQHPIDCEAGYIDVNGVCLPITIINEILCPRGQVNYNGSCINEADWPKGGIKPDPTQTVIPVTLTNNVNAFDIRTFFEANKSMVLIGAAVVAYLLLKK